MAHHAIQSVPLTRRQRWLYAAALAALAVAASWNGILNDFTYDDRFIVLGNDAIHDLHNWWRFFVMPYWPVRLSGDGYRPLTTLAFALEWAAGQGRPWIFHAVNIGLYTAVSVAVFWVAETCLPFAAAWIAAALFAVHPLHVEAVANVVGQAELLAGLFTIVAVVIYIRRRNSNELGAGTVVAISVLYAAACLSKEHGIALPAVLLAAELTIVVDGAPIRDRLARLRLLGLALALVAVAFLGAHAASTGAGATGFHPYTPFNAIGLDAAGRVFTMLGVVPHWFRLLLWPAHLSSEYGPPAYPVVPDFHLYQLPGLILVVAVLLLAVAARRREPAVSFGIAFMVITLLPSSNFVVPAGILFSERTLFLPSVGMMIVVARALPWLHSRARGWAPSVAGIAAISVLLTLGIWRSIERTKVWKNNDTLFRQAVIDAPFVYRSHYVRAQWQLNQRRKAEGEREYQIAISLYDKDPGMFYSLGEEYRQWGIFEPAITMYRRTLEADSTFFEARAKLAMSYAALGRFPEAKREALLALSHNTRFAKSMLDILRLDAFYSRKARNESTAVAAVRR